MSLLAPDQACQPIEPRAIRLGQQAAEDVMAGHQRDGRGRVGQGEQLEQFIRLALAGQGEKIVASLGAGGQRGRIGLALAEAGVEAEEAQDAEVILGDAFERIADEPHPALGEIVEAAEPVVDLAADRIRVERVDREVAAAGVGLPIVGEGDFGMAAVGRDVAAQGRHFHRTFGRDRGYRAMGDAGRNRLHPCLGYARDDVFRPQPRGEVDIGDRQAEQRVAHGAADHLGRAIAGIQRGEQPEQPRPLAPVCRRQPHGW